MCGLTGFWSRGGGQRGGAFEPIARRMADTLVHRGPGDAGVWCDPDQGIALGFRRLAIVDLTPTGHQPMASGRGRYVVAYNGEIYNYRELRRDLEARGIAFRGTSDTEVMLEAFELWGVEATLARLNGMFAVALWDRAEARLHLARDPVGIKPLYWAVTGQTVLFGSELKALAAHPAFKAEIDPSAVAAYLRLAYVPAPHTIWRGVRKLEPGTHLTIGQQGEAGTARFWDVAEVARRGAIDAGAMTDAEATDALDTLLRDAVGKQMVADVPLGAFLSGGIDSSTVVALMQAQSTRPVRTFTIGFSEAVYNEAEHARAVARHLGTEHTEVTIEPAHARAAIPRLAEIYDEPFADSSQLPTLLLSEITRRSVTVALSGDGGDELFAGYDRYRIAAETWQRIARVPAAAKPLVRAGLRAAASPGLAAALQRAPRALGLGITGGRLDKLALALEGNGPDDLYAEIVSHWGRPEALLPGVAEAQSAVTDRRIAGHIGDFGQRMRLVDMLTYLPDDILAKVDRASMAVSLEARVPLLDHRVVELAWRLEQRHLVRGQESKWLLRQVLDRYVPRALIERPKMGFAVPIGDWLRGPLRDWAEDLLSAKALAASGLVPGPVRAKWLAHAKGVQGGEYPLWTVLMLQAWMRRWA